MAVSNLNSDGFIHMRMRIIFPLHININFNFNLLLIVFCSFFTEPITTIHGSPDLYIDTGSTVNLTCIVRHLPEPPAAIQWTHNNEVSIPLRSPFGTTLSYSFPTHTNINAPIYTQ